MAWPWQQTRYEEVELPKLDLPPMTDEWNQKDIDNQSTQKLNDDAAKKKGEKEK